MGFCASVALADVAAAVAVPELDRAVGKLGTRPEAEVHPMTAAGGATT